MSTATELLRRADEICSRAWDPKAEELSEDIRSHLASEPEADEDECEKFLNTRLPFPVKFANGKNGAGTTIRTLLIRLENQNKHVEELIERVKASAEPEAPVECVHVPLTIWKHLKKGRITAEDLVDAVKKANAEERAEKEAEPLPSFLTEQEPLGGEFSRILDKHRWDLYERGGGECQLKPVEPEAEPVACVNTPLSMVYPEYNRRVLGARPEPSRKPMTEEEISDAYESYISKHSDYSEYYAFCCAIRVAEKHHFGIGGGDE